MMSRARPWMRIPTMYLCLLMMVLSDGQGETLIAARQRIMGWRMNLRLGEQNIRVELNASSNALAKHILRERCLGNATFGVTCSLKWLMHHVRVTVARHLADDDAARFAWEMDDASAVTRLLRGQSGLFPRRRRNAAARAGLFMSVRSPIVAQMMAAALRDAFPAMSVAGKDRWSRQRSMSDSSTGVNRVAIFSAKLLA